MNNKTRLEKAKIQRQKKSTALDYLDLDIDWLIRQAERNDQLTERNKKNNEEIKLLKQEIARLRVVEQAYEAMKKAL